MTKTQQPAGEVQRYIEGERGVVGAIAKEREPAGVTNHNVEFIAVKNEVALAVGRFVNGIATDFDVAEVHARVVAQTIVVVAWDEDDACSLARFPQQLLQHVIMALRPVWSAPNFPEVDDVADQIKMLAFDVFQEIEERGRLAIAHSKMDVGNEYGPIVQFRIRCAQGRPPVSALPINASLHLM